MDRTLVAVFDSNDEARAACEALRQSGIPDDRVHLQSGTEFADADTSRDHRSWFSRLFSGSDVNDEHIGEYSESVRRGSCVVVVDAVDESRIDAAAQIMAQHHAIDMDERAARWREQGWTGYDASAPAFLAEDPQRDRELYRNERMDTAGQRTNMTGEGATRIPVVEEELQVGKREVQRGGVRVHTRVTERPIEENVTLREEHARVERHPVDRDATEADLGAAFKEGAVELRETAEEAVVNKKARVVEEIELDKEVSERTETVRDNVRRTNVEVEDLPGARTKETDTAARTRKRP